MKKVLCLLALAFMTATASAQIVSSNSRNVTSEPGDYSAYNRLSLNYQQLKGTSHGYDTDGVDGVNVEFVHGFNVLKSQPLYVETGLSASFNKKTDLIDILRIGVPANLAYKYTFQSIGFWIQPFAGLDLICNAYVDEDNKDDVKRIQGGWHVGTNIGYKSINLGIKYGSDFTDLADEIKSKSFTIGLGYNF